MDVGGCLHVLTSRVDAGSCMALLFVLHGHIFRIEYGEFGLIDWR
jgi:hypothetical protein